MTRSHMQIVSAVAEIFIFTVLITDMPWKSRITRKKRAETKAGHEVAVSPKRRSI